jgi:hypothetical protein
MDAGRLIDDERLFFKHFLRPLSLKKRILGDNFKETFSLAIVL